ncbi:MAG: hypothetical protein E6R13_02320 [Spirochaetes bacterium]|nr:MAG: hypothetical protein E6R13_02320 [Spirochaetota bacterium]
MEYSVIDLNLPDDVIEFSLNYLKTNYYDVLKISGIENSFTVGNTEDLPDVLKTYLSNDNILTIENYIPFAVNLLILDSLDFYFSLDKVVSFMENSDE